MWDSVDKEYMGMGSSSQTCTEVYDTEILVHLTGDFLLGLVGLCVDEVEVLETISHADFGEIEPDYGDDEEYVET